MAVTRKRAGQNVRESGKCMCPMSHAISDIRTLKFLVLMNFNAGIVDNLLPEFMSEQKTHSVAQGGLIL